MEEKKNSGASASETELVAKFEEAVRADLVKYLQGEKMLDEVVPECPDVEEKWPEIVKASKCTLDGKNSGSRFAAFLRWARLHTNL